MTHANPLARFAPFGATPPAGATANDSTGISESRKGLSGANPRHCGLTAPARDATGIAATLICLCLRVFHNHLRRGSAALGPRHEPWGYRCGFGTTSPRPITRPCDPMIAHRPTHCRLPNEPFVAVGAISKSVDVNLPALSRD